MRSGFFVSEESDRGRRQRACVRAILERIRGKVGENNGKSISVGIPRESKKYGNPMEG